MEILSNTLLYVLGLSFALRSGQEHRGLSRDQLMLKYNQNVFYLEYAEWISKINQKGLKQVGVKPKVFRAYESSNAARCVVNLYRKYISLCHVDLPGSSPFYLWPVKKPSATRWYGIVPTEKNTLAGTMAHICESTGFKVNINIFWLIF